MRFTATMLVLFALGACSRRADSQRIEATLSVAELLGGSPDPAFARALEPREFTFPRDHGPHPEFQTEWWYFTGNLEDERGRAFGYQLTFFRRALRPEVGASTSAWSARDIYLAHFAISDVEADEFHAFERFSRTSLELAGARGEPMRVWLRDWNASGDPQPGSTTHLSATDDGAALELDLRATKTPVLQGENGLSRKGHEPGNASYYYSSTRIDTHGRITLGAKSFEVHGTSWFDREWSTSALEHGQIGWDWFALQLDDGTELMAFAMRREDGSLDAANSANFVAADGTTTHLDASDFEVEVLAHWKSPSSGADYPSKWRVRVPSKQLDLVVEPALADQELRLSVRYWEGAVRVRRNDGQHQACGRGYVELTGY